MKIYELPNAFFDDKQATYIGKDKVVCQLKKMLYGLRN